MDPQNRELVFCHSCEEEWFRDEHGLTCPHCHSEFTEIIEANHDPRIEQMAGLGDLHQRHPLHDHNPWAHPDDPDEDDIDNFRFHPAPGGFTMTGTVHRTFPPNTMPAREPAPRPALHDLMNNFTSMLAGITGPQDPTEERRNSTGEYDQRSPTPDPRSPLESNIRGGRFEIRSSGGQGPRFTYTSTTYPRDPNNPQGGLPVDAIQNVLNDIFGQPGIGQPGMGHPNEQNPRDGSNAPPPPLAPLAALLQAMLGVPPGGVYGDGVYTQEAFDRIVTQLMEQNASGSAPGPATAEDIAAIPKVKVDKELLGDSGKAECSICMDEVQLGDLVARLPCTHWFHPACIEAWLGEHDTCPHCRKGISESSDPKTDASDPESSQPGGPATATAASSDAPFHPRQSSWAAESGATQSSGFQSGYPPQGQRYFSEPPHSSQGGAGTEREDAGASSHQQGDGSQSITDRIRNYFTGGRPNQGSEP